MEKPGGPHRAQTICAGKEPPNPSSGADGRFPPKEQASPKPPGRGRHQAETDYPVNPHPHPAVGLLPRRALGRPQNQSRFRKGRRESETARPRFQRQPNTSKPATAGRRNRTRNHPRARRLRLSQDRNLLLPRPPGSDRPARPPKTPPRAPRPFRSAARPRSEQGNRPRARGAGPGLPAPADPASCAHRPATLSKGHPKLFQFPRRFLNLNRRDGREENYPNSWQFSPVGVGRWCVAMVVESPLPGAAPQVRSWRALPGLSSAATRCARSFGKSRNPIAFVQASREIVFPFRTP